MDMWLALTALIILVALAVIAVGIYNFFEGETLVSDTFDEFRLRRTSLAGLDADCARNPDKSEAIISLTTIPSRLPLIALTLKSLLRQSRAPRRIVLNLPEFSKREKVPYVIPDELKSLACVEIARCEDMGPATKAIPTLLRETPEQLVIIVDDDRIYPANLVADLEDAARAARTMPSA